MFRRLVIGAPARPVLRLLLVSSVAFAWGIAPALAQQTINTAATGQAGSGGGLAVDAVPPAWGPGGSGGSVGQSFVSASPTAGGSGGNGGEFRYDYNNFGHSGTAGGGTTGGAGGVNSNASGDVGGGRGGGVGGGGGGGAGGSFSTNGLTRGAGGGGGGGGGTGIQVNTGVAIEIIGVTATGGAGGEGGESLDRSGSNLAGGGGGGGGGGGSAIVSNGHVTLSSGGSALGGAGGAGGRSNTNAGSGGAGGHGIEITGASGATVTIGNGSTVRGGDAGAKGVRRYNAFSGTATDGAAGNGIIGQNLTIVANGGAIEGGLSGGERASAILFSGGANTLTQGSATYQGGIQIASGATLTLAQASDATLGAALTGSGAITKTGAGILTLTAASTHTGSLTINAGAVRLGAGGSLASVVTVANGASFDFGATTQTLSSLAGLSGSGSFGGGGAITADILNTETSTANFGGVNFALTKTGTGSLTLAGTLSYSGPTTVGAGTLVLSGNNSLTGGITVSGKLVIGASGAAGGAGNTITTTGSVVSFGNGVNSATPIAINSNTTQLEVVGTDAATQSGVISEIGGPRPVEKIGTGTLTLAAANTYSGLLTVTAGTLVQGVAGALPSGAPVAVAAGATLDTGGFATSLGGLSGAGNLTGTGAVTVDAATDATFSGVISGTGLSLTKSGIGTLTLSGANSYDGTTTVTGGVLSVSASNNLGAATNALALAGGTLAITNHLQTSRSLTVSGANSAVDVQAVGASALSPSGLTLDSGVTFNSQLQKLGAGILRLNAAGSGAGGIAVTAGTLTLNDNQAAGTGALALAAGTTLTTETVGTLTLANAVSLTGAGQRLVAGPTGAGSSLVLGGAISGAGGLKLTGGTLRLNGANSFSGGVEATAGSLIIGNSLALGSGPLTLGGGASLTAAVDGLRLANAIDVGGLHSLRVNAGLTLTLDGAITGTGMIRHDVGGVLRLNAANSFSGGLTVVDGTVEAGASGSLGTGTLFLHTTGAGTPALRAGASSVTLANRIELNNLRAPVIDTQANTLTLTGVIANGQTVGGGAESASLVKSGSGTLILNGVNTYTGATSVNAGKLVVNGSIASSSGLTIAQGASLGGNGSVPRLTVNGTIAPGNSVGVLRVNGGLTLSSTAVTAIEIEGNAADRIEVTGSAILNGTLQLIAAGTPYSFGTPYTILTTTGARGGTFATVTTTGSFGVGVTSDVIYGSNAVQVTLTAAPLAPIVTNPAASAAPVAGGSTVASATAGSVPGTRNVVAVARGLDNARNAGANLSSLFPIYNQPTAAALQTALNTVSGEVHTASMAIGQRASDQFLRVMLDPSALGRDGSLLAGTAGETGNAPAPLFRRSYQVWGASFGGVDRVGGERRTVGSTEREIRDLNLAVGADFLVAPGTIAGFALSGGQSRAKLGEGLGSSEGNIFQAGLYGSSRLGALELGASAAYSAIATETSRLIPALGLNARADYTLSVWGGRLQGAYEIWNGNGLTLSPVAAVQAQSVQMPSFVERTSLTGAVAGLAGQNQTRTTLRTELGLRVSQKLSLGGYKAALSGQIAWGHYALREAEFTASVAGVAGSAFTITGARPARDVMLLSTGLDLELAPNITFGSRFDLNAGQNTRSYAGSAVLRASF